MPVGVISASHEEQAVSAPGEQADSPAAPPLTRNAFALEIAARVDEGSVSVREDKQAAGPSDDHASAARAADAGATWTPTHRHQPDEALTGRIHYSADVRHTVVMERPRWRRVA